MPQERKTLTGRDYSAAEVFDLERERIFARSWFYAGRAEGLDEPGDFVAVDVAGESVIVLRTKAGDLRAFYNVCRHRGSRLCDAESGRMKGAVKCPYHAWSYSFDGKLIGTPNVGKDEVDRDALPDLDETLVPKLRNFIYDAWFFSDNLPASQVLEFDVSQYFDGKAFIFGNQCRIAGGHEWDIWDNVNNRWVATGIACNPANNSWNHVVIQVQRTSDNRLFYQSITLNGVTQAVNRYFGQHSAPAGWHGITLNFQMDGNYKQTPYTVFLDKLHFTYW
jgi:nitrite reductase/ring-hydroxylating ferredoxin subunit